MENGIEKVQPENNANSQEGRQGSLQTGHVWTVDYLAWLLPALQRWEEHSDADIRETAARMRLASMAMESTAPSTLDPVKALIDTWQSALTRGGLTVPNYGLLNTLLSEVSSGKAPILQRFGRYTKIRTRYD